MPEKLYTVAETAKILSVGKTTIYEQLKKGTLKGLQFAGIKIRESEIQRFIEALSDNINVEEESK